MIYPEFLKENDAIGITAPSDGNSKVTDFIRLNNGKNNLIERGYQIIETANVRGSEKGRSSDPKTRAKEFMELFINPLVKWIISAKGGDFLVEMLPFLDFEKIKSNPTWFQGFSDNTGLTFTIATNCNIATIYGCNFNDFGMQNWHKTITNNLLLVEGREIEQVSFSLYEDSYYERITGLEDYILNKPVFWKNITNQEKTEMSGRLLGGCLDVMLNLVGTKFDNTISFISQYEKDGILWYLESFGLSSEELTRGLWQLKEAGWFYNARGFVFGRPAFYEENFGISYEEVVLNILGDLKVPIILDADIGHKAPQMTIINGAMGYVSWEDGKGSLKMRYN